MKDMTRARKRLPCSDWLKKLVGKALKKGPGSINAGEYTSGLEQSTRHAKCEPGPFFPKPDKSPPQPLRIAKPGLDRHLFDAMIGDAEEMAGGIGSRLLNEFSWCHRLENQQATM